MTQVSITDIPGIKVGHATDSNAMTGCTVVLCEDGAVAGIDIRGSAPGTIETDCLDSSHLVQSIHAVLLTGGSAYGLAAAGGVMRYLEERGVGHKIGDMSVPIVPGAVIFDLLVGDGSIRPNSNMGYAACLQATEDSVPTGSIGAGTGATVGKILGHGFAMKGGVGSSGCTLSSGVTVGALTVVNALGDIIDPESCEIIAGARDPESGAFLDTVQVMKENFDLTVLAQSNTTLSVVATNASLTKVQATKVARMAHNGLARTIRPCHTMVDGDTVFALSLGNLQADVSLIGSVAADMVAESIIDAVRVGNSVD